MRRRDVVRAHAAGFDSRIWFPRISSRIIPQLSPIHATMNIAELRRHGAKFQNVLDERKRELVAHEIPWYPYGTLSNLQWLELLLDGHGTALADLLGEGPIADIGAADGDIAFLLDSLGYDVDIVDYPPTNYNSCRAAHALKAALGARVNVVETDLDRRFELPRTAYSFAFFMGILYHLKNPFGALESLAQHARHAIVSTRIARYSATPGTASRVELAPLPLAYLLGPDECNNDATNFWIFSEGGLRRLFDRTGWEVLAWKTVGDTKQSDPASQAGDERAFCLLRSLA
jgi:tRNA (mo5U34)-methyltransferase